MDPVEALGQDFIEHHGIPGMKWGVHRSRGSSITKGRAGRTTYAKTPHRLSDHDLSKRIKRLEMEKKYHELNAPIKSKGKEYVHSLLENTGKTAAGIVVGTTATFFIQRALKAKFG